MLFIAEMKIYLFCCKLCIRKVTNPCCGALHESSDEQSQQDLPWYLKILKKQARDHHNWLQWCWWRMWVTKFLWNARTKISKMLTIWCWWQFSNVCDIITLMRKYSRLVINVLQHLVCNIWHQDLCSQNSSLCWFLIERLDIGNKFDCNCFTRMDIIVQRFWIWRSESEDIPRLHWTDYIWGSCKGKSKLRTRTG